MNFFLINFYDSNLNFLFTFLDYLKLIKEFLKGKQNFLKTLKKQIFLSEKDTRPPKPEEALFVCLISLISVQRLKKNNFDHEIEI